MNEKRIESIITAYKKLRTDYPDYSLIDCAAAGNLQHAIEMAATARDLARRKHRHQYRIKNSTLQDFSHSLLSIQQEIGSAASFGALYKLVEQNKIKGISDITVYDTAQRIGCFLNLFPEDIYLHGGTRTGAEILLGKIKGKTIAIEQLPAPFQIGLSPSEIEDILCIYKDRLANCI